jgi:hypothetical protein
VRFDYLLVFLAIFSGNALAETIDIEFHSRHKGSYRTTNLSADIKKNYGIDIVDEKVLLIETPLLSSPQYKTQLDELNAFGHKAEQYQIMFVVACQNEEPSGGYYTTTEEARRLSKGEPIFRVRLLDAKGVVMNISDHPITDKALTGWLER